MYEGVAQPVTRKRNHVKKLGPKQYSSEQLAEDARERAPSKETPCAPDEEKEQADPDEEIEVGARHSVGAKLLTQIPHTTMPVHPT